MNSRAHGFRTITGLKTTTVEHTEEELLTKKTEMRAKRAEAVLKGHAPDDSVAKKAATERRVKK